MFENLKHYLGGMIGMFWKTTELLNSAGIGFKLSVWDVYYDAA